MMATAKLPGPFASRAAISPATPSSSNPAAAPALVFGSLTERILRSRSATGVGPLQLGYPGLATTLKPWISAMPGAVNATPAECRMP